MSADPCRPPRVTASALGGVHVSAGASNSGRETPRFPSSGGGSGGTRMDDVLNRMARELSDAIVAVVAEDPRVEACRERVRAAGYEMRVSLEAVIGFVNRTTPGALAKVGAPQKALRGERRSVEMSANDRRFLRSLRIAADETQEKEVE